jgi:hypothetical protein
MRDLNLLRGDLRCVSMWGGHGWCRAENRTRRKFAFLALPWCEDLPWVLEVVVKKVFLCHYYCILSLEKTMTFTPCVDKWMLEQLWQYVRDDWTKRHILGNLFCLAAAWIKWVDISTCQFFTPLVAVWDLGSHWLSLSLVCGIWFWWEFMESFGEIQSKSFCTDIFLALGPGCGLIPACYLCWSLVFVWP